MASSEARTRANRQNCLKSTGPSEAGRRITRMNAYKHGMTATVVAPADEQKAVEEMADSLLEFLGAEGPSARPTALRAAAMTARLRRCERFERAAVLASVTRAQADFDEAREEEVDALMKLLENDSPVALRKLMRMPEGVDRIIDALRGYLERVDSPAFDAHDRKMADRVDRLIGRPPGGEYPRLAGPLFRALLGDGDGLDGDNPAFQAETPAQAKESLRVQLWELIDAEITGLEEYRATLDLEGLAKIREAAGDLALFDASEKSQLAQRYEAAAERSLKAAMKELKALAAVAEPEIEETAPEPVAPEPKPAEPEPAPLASFRAPVVQPVAPVIVDSIHREIPPAKQAPIPQVGPSGAESQSIGGR